jgi:uncharacterized protein YndB with AHSA1/START domain
MPKAKSEAKQIGEFEFVISRVFDAPRDLVWKAWTEPDRLLKWWGPRDFDILSAKVDLRVGGIFLYHLRSPDGLEIWGKFVYREITQPGKLVYINSFSDPAGGTTRAPFFEGKWPLEILSTVTLAKEGSKTRVEIRWIPYSASEIERKTFEDGAGSMQQGWTGTLDNLTEYLAAL